MLLGVEWTMLVRLLVSLASRLDLLSLMLLFEFRLSVSLVLKGLVLDLSLNQ